MALFKQIARWQVRAQAFGSNQEKWQPFKEAHGGFFHTAWPFGKTKALSEALKWKKSMTAERTFQIIQLAEDLK